MGRDAMSIEVIGTGAHLGQRARSRCSRLLSGFRSPLDHLDRPVAAVRRDLSSTILKIPWRLVMTASYVGTNLILIPLTIRLGEAVSIDWVLWRELPEALASGRIYEISDRVPFVWSPIAAWIMAGVTYIGYWPWAALHVLAVFALRDLRAISLVLLSYGFWFDVAQGNTIAFALVAGLLALQGRRWGAMSFLVLTMLTPRPLMIPLAAWLLWTDRSLWRPTAALFAIHGMAVVAMGYAGPWLEAMATYVPTIGVSIGPTGVIGRWWLLAGIPLGTWLLLRGYPSVAGLAMSPYVLPQYLVWPVLDLVRSGTECTRTQASPMTSAIARPQPAIEGPRLVPAATSAHGSGRRSA